LKQLYSNSAFRIYIGMLIVGGILLLFQDKGDFVLWLNDNHGPVADTFFKYWTYLGDGWIFAIIFIATLFYNYYSSLLLTVAIIIQTIIVQLSKRVLFNGMVRPKMYFEDNSLLNMVEGVDVHSYHSFPSGHTATAFLAAAFLIVMTKNKTISIIGILVAFLVGISRVFLLQHFLIDIYVGSMVGFGSVLLFYFPSQRIGLHKKSPWKRSLISKGN